MFHNWFTSPTISSLACPIWDWMYTRYPTFLCVCIHDIEVGTLGTKAMLCYVLWECLYPHMYMYSIG